MPKKQCALGGILCLLALLVISCDISGKLSKQARNYHKVPQPSTTYPADLIEPIQDVDSLINVETDITNTEINYLWSQDDELIFSIDGLKLGFSDTLQGCLSAIVQPEQTNKITIRHYIFPETHYYVTGSIITVDSSLHSVLKNISPEMMAIAAREDNPINYVVVSVDYDDTKRLINGVLNSEPFRVDLSEWSALRTRDHFILSDNSNTSTSVWRQVSRRVAIENGTDIEFSSGSSVFLYEYETDLVIRISGNTATYYRVEENLKEFMDKAGYGSGIIEGMFAADNAYLYFGLSQPFSIVRVEQATLDEKWNTEQVVSLINAPVYYGNMLIYEKELIVLWPYNNVLLSVKFPQVEHT